MPDSTQSATLEACSGSHPATTGSGAGHSSGAYTLSSCSKEAINPRLVSESSALSSTSSVREATWRKYCIDAGDTIGPPVVLAGEVND